MSGPGSENILLSALANLPQPTASTPLSVRSGPQMNQCMSPFLRLPRETVQEIFSLCTLYDSYRYNTYSKHPIPFIYLGHICGELRSTLLGMHNIWADVVCALDDIEIVRELVQRAASSPLTTVMTRTTFPDESIRFVASRFQQARVIKISSARVIRMVLNDLEGAHLPLLEDLVFDNGALSTIRTTPETVDAQSLTIRCFDRATMGTGIPFVTPNLKRLRMMNAILPLPLSLSNLCDLRLDVSPPESPMWAAYLLRILRLCASVRTLELKNMRFPLVLTMNEKRVALPEIRLLDIAGDTQCLMWFWSQITVPSDARVLMDVADVASDDESITWDFINSLSSHMHGNDARTVTGFSIFPSTVESDLFFGLYVTAESSLPGRDDHRFSPLYHGYRRVLDVRLSWCEVNMENILHYMNRLRDIFDLSEVETLEIGTLEEYHTPEEEKDDEDFVGYEQWLSVFPNIRHLCLSSNPYLACTALGPNATDKQPIYPHLRSLTLLNAMFDENELNSFLMMLKERACSGTGLEELKFAFCDAGALGLGDDMVSQSFRTTVQSLVPSVEFGLLNGVY
ncbi:unnamed protein product [Peniophora sp. CBMAI 1063]|nr:unnamed protein product [Peniophora sp. CBMAI 1063]